MEELKYIYQIIKRDELEDHPGRSTDSVYATFYDKQLAYKWLPRLIDQYGGFYTVVKHQVWERQPL